MCVRGNHRGSSIVIGHPFAVLHVSVYFLRKEENRNTKQEGRGLGAATGQQEKSLIDEQNSNNLTEIFFPKKAAARSRDLLLSYYRLHL